MLFSGEVKLTTKHDTAPNIWIRLQRKLGKRDLQKNIVAVAPLSDLRTKISVET